MGEDFPPSIWTTHIFLRIGDLKKNPPMTPPKFNSSPLKNDGKGRRSGFLLGPGKFSGVNSLLNFTGGGPFFRSSHQINPYSFSKSAMETIENRRISQNEAVATCCTSIQSFVKAKFFLVFLIRNGSTVNPFFGKLAFLGDVCVCNFLHQIGMNSQKLVSIIIRESGVHQLRL